VDNGHDTLMLVDGLAGVSELMPGIHVESGEGGRWDLVAIVEGGGPAAHLAAEMARALDELAQTTSDFSVGAARSSQSVEMIGKEIEGLRDELEGLARRASSLLSSSGEGANTAREAADVTSELLSETERGIAVVGRVIEGLGALSTRTEQVAELVDGLARGELSDISSFSSIIDGVAKQTKLLALNAAIEAARAGEHGRGFAVVADEVGRLASETAAQTAQIAQTIARTQTQMKAVQQAASAARERAAEGAGDANEGRGALEELSTLIDSSSGRSTRIAEIAAQQLVDAGAVNDAIVAIAASSARIEEQAHTLASHQLSLSTGTEDASQVIGRFRTSGAVSRWYGCCQELAQELREVFEDAIERREVTLEEVLALDYQEVRGPLIERFARLFDVSRVPPEGFDPPKFVTAYDAVVDRQLTVRLDAALASDPKLSFAAITDLNCYAPAHTSDATADWTGDHETDLLGNRTKRFFIESGAILRSSRMGIGVDLPPRPLSRTEMLAAGAQLGEPPAGAQGFLLQTYARDTGEVLTTLSVPLHVRGQRYGRVTIGWDPERLHT
jgi:methyl-accepting chemotaxis protein